MTSLGYVVPILAVRKGGKRAGSFVIANRMNNVGKNPAGTPDGLLSFTTGIETKLSLEDCGVLDQIGVNCLMDEEVTGRSVWGCNTLVKDRADRMRFVNARRTMNYVKVLLYKGFWSVAFENNGPALWADLQRRTATVMDGLFKSGFFKGSAAKDAYLVVCDGTNNTQATTDALQVVCDVAFAVHKPGLYVSFRVAQRAS